MKTISSIYYWTAIFQIRFASTLFFCLYRLYFNSFFKFQFLTASCPFVQLNSRQVERYPICRHPISFSLTVCESYIIVMSPKAHCQVKRPIIFENAVLFGCNFVLRLSRLAIVDTADAFRSKSSNDVVHSSFLIFGFHHLQ